MNVRRAVTLQETPVPPEIPGFVLVSGVVFPNEVVSVQLDRPRSVRLVEDNPDESVLLACLYPAESDIEDDDSPAAIRRKTLPVGVACRLIHRMRMPNDTYQVVLQGLRRVRLVDVLRVDPTHLYRVEELDRVDPASPTLDRLMERCLAQVEELVGTDPGYSTELVNLLRLNRAGADRFADLLASRLHLSMPEKRRLAATADPRERLELLLAALREAVMRRRLRDEVSREAQNDIDRRTRETLLREEMRAIRRELGEEPDASQETERLRARVLAADLPAAARDAARDDLDRLALLPVSTPEHVAVKGHLEWILDLPWNVLGAQKVDLARAREILDRDHYGLEDVKERLLEILAVLDRDPTGPLPTVCLVGPPGTGKTSLGRSLAQACGRAFVRASVAGTENEAEIHGARRSQIGAGPGAVVRGLKRAGTRDPVFMIDEVDDMGREDAGDPASALVEVIDPELKAEFVDEYLDVPLDLTRVFFVATASVSFDVPRALRDRMEIITLPGYTREEKFQIARRHLLPRALLRTGFGPEDVTFSDDALRELVSSYTREAGVRSLERSLARACRRLALLRATGRPAPAVVEAATLPELLGQPPYEDDPLLRDPAIGVATGLAWTSDGGVMQLIEAIAMAGSGRIVVTGRLGDVMRESADIAYSWVRANVDTLGLDDKKIQSLDLHIHAPEGGVRKDGPSTGVAIATAIVSVFGGRPIRPDVAMTGELTLRGRVLAVGGIREKVSAAHRAGVRHVLLPTRNRKDVEALTPELRAEMRFEFLDDVMQYLEAALLPSASAEKPPEARAVRAKRS
jgi:ATP-dependent Lon protease